MYSPSDIRNYHIADKFIRIPRPRESRIVVRILKHRHFKHLLSSNPLLVSVLGIALVILIGGLLLLLPIANTQGDITDPLAAFFTAASAVSTTGLTIVQTATYWSFFGQAVICILIFVGGLGLVTAVMFNLWLLGTRLTLRDRLLVREAMVSQNIGGLVRMLRNVMLLDISITLIGTIILVGPFHNYYNFPDAVWQALFHSVSAFNTAGFDIVGPASLTPFRNDAFLLGTAITESVLGALSFSVLLEVPVVRFWKRYSLNTKLVLSMTLMVAIVSIITVSTGEISLGTTMDDFSTGGMIFTSIFNGLSASTTTGFSTIDFGQVTTLVLILITGVMFIGGATGSTAGGIKVNTLSAILANIWSTTRGKSYTELFGREIEQSQVLRAVTVVFVSATVVMFGILLIMISNPEIAFEKVLFEVTSAFGTVGLSTGELSNFSTFSRIVVILLMFVGRVTPLSVTMVLARYRRHSSYRYPKESIKIG